MKQTFLFFVALMLTSATYAAKVNNVYIKDIKTGNYWCYDANKKLITAESQLYANSQQSNDFRVGRLINTSTNYSGIIFHTAWNTSGGGTPLPAGVDNYIQFHFNEPHDDIAFNMIGSNWSNTYDTPDHIIIEATNTPNDESSWQEIVEMPDLIPEALHLTYPAKYNSPRIGLNAEYTDVRMVVKATVNNRSNGNGNILVSLARMQMFDPYEITDPHVIDSLKQAEIDAILNPLLDSVTILTNRVMGVGAQPLIEREDQLSTNSQQSNQYRVGNLINTTTDYTNIIYHTSWSNPLDAGVLNYFSVHLDKGVNHFVFRIIGSNYPKTYDTPDYVIIKGTNTPKKSATWKQIAEIKDLIPAAQHSLHPAKYTSNIISYDSVYTDFRFFVKTTTSGRTNTKGNIFVSMARFQLCGDQSVEDAPYSKIAGLQAAQDSLMEAVATVKIDPSATNIAQVRSYYNVVKWILLNGSFEPGKEPVNIVFIGNSITQGAGVTDANTQSAPVKCVEKITKDTGRTVEFHNCGQSGSTTVNWLPKTNLFQKANAAATLLAENGGYLFFNMMLGTNDSAESGTTGAPVSPETYEENMKTIIKTLHQSHPDAIFVVNYPIWYSPNTHNGAVYKEKGLARLKSYHPIIDQFVADLQKEGINIITGSKDAFGFFEEKTQYFTAENGNSGVFYLHPNAAGAECLGNFWAQSIMDYITVTGVEENLKPKTNANTNANAIFNLSGQRLSKVQKGINIVDGKKVLF